MTKKLSEPCCSMLRPPVSERTSAHRGYVGDDHLTDRIRGQCQRSNASRRCRSGRLELELDLLAPEEDADLASHRADDPDSVRHAWLEGSSYPGSSYPGLISSFQFVAGFMNFFREVAIPATLCCFCEIETETRDCSSPGSHMSSPAASTLPALILSGDLNWDRMYRLPRLAVPSRRCAVLCFRRVVVRRSYCQTGIRRCRRSPHDQPAGDAERPRRRKPASRAGFRVVGATGFEPATFRPPAELKLM